MIRENKVRILTAFDAVYQVQEFTPHHSGSGKGGGGHAICGYCKGLLASIPAHQPDCPIDAAQQVLNKLVPTFADRDKWLSESEKDKQP